MDFDYETVKDAESNQREKLPGCQPIKVPRPMPRPSIAPESQLASRNPPIKPRRSIKMRATTQEGTGQSNNRANQKEAEGGVKRIAPSQVLCPPRLLEAQTPCLRAHILWWFQKTQLPRLYTPGGLMPSWLHGFATRREAEQLLQDKQQGCFLLRLSESKVGFVLSYRGADRCRHFIIEEESEVSGVSGQYLIAGEQSRHNSLEELINYYSHNPVGPFDETLTTPCMQGDGSREDVPKPEAGDDVGIRDATAENMEAVPQPSGERPATGSAHSHNRSAQYAVIRKALRKTLSLPECKIGPDMVLPIENNDVHEPAVGSPTLAGAGNETQPVEAQYARVNKPPRVALQNPSVATTDPSHQGAMAAITPQSLSGTASIAEQKYWELEPLHTYEETLHIPTGNEEINFYAMDRRQEIAGDHAFHHLYSEVNIKGTKDDLKPMPAPPPIRAASMCNSAPPSTRPKPILPQRHVRRANASSRPENSLQSCGGAAGMTTPPFSPITHQQQLPASSTFSIYEQIPERSSNSRPLPPPNPKR